MKKNQFLLPIDAAPTNLRAARATALTVAPARGADRGEPLSERSSPRPSRPAHHRIPTRSTWRKPSKRPFRPGRSSPRKCRSQAASLSSDSPAVRVQAADPSCRRDPRDFPHVRAIGSGAVLSAIWATSRKDCTGCPRALVDPLSRQKKPARSAPTEVGHRDSAGLRGCRAHEGLLLGQDLVGALRRGTWRPRRDFGLDVRGVPLLIWSVARDQMSHSTPTASFERARFREITSATLFSKWPTVRQFGPFGCRIPVMSDTRSPGLRLVAHAGGDQPTFPARIRYGFPGGSAEQGAASRAISMSRGRLPRRVRASASDRVFR